MHHQPNSLIRWVLWHRRELAAGIALIFIACLFLVALPPLLLLALVELRASRRRKRVIGLVLAGLLTRVVCWLWRDLRRVPHGRWHPCAHCGIPIEEPSRARYCSSACRRYARLERDARAFDSVIAERAEHRLRMLCDDAFIDPALSEIPF
jgi:hypothetical protein